MKELREIRAGVIGVGSMGQNHARIYSELANFVAVSDLNEQSGQDVAERFGVAYFKDYREMLSEIDAVSIAVPTSLHREVAEEVAAAGVHMLVEKPLASNLADAEAIVRTADAAGVTLAVGHVERYNSVVTHAKTCIDKGDWGEILTISARRFSSYPGRIHDVGVMFDMSIHDVDVICHLINSNVRTVYAVGGRSNNLKYEDYVSLVLNFDDGRVGLCQTNWLTPMKVREMDITTNTCYINLNYLNEEIKILTSEFKNVDESNLYRPSIAVSEQKVSPEGIEPLKNELLDFLVSVSEKKMPMVSGLDGLRAVRIVEAGLKSMAIGSAVNIQE